MKKPTIYSIAALVFAAIIIAVAGFYIASQKAEDKTYTNAEYGVSFAYPGEYELREEKVTEGQSGTVVVIHERGVNIPENGEGPTAITVAMYDKGTSTLSLLPWIRTSPYSNFSLAKQADPGVTQVGGQDGYLYTWDGLYQGTTVVTEHKGNIIMLSVTYDGETDMEKREAFTALVESLELFEPGTQATSTPQE